MNYDKELHPGKQRVSGRGGKDKGQTTGKKRAKQRVMRREGLRTTAHLAALQQADGRRLYDGFMSLPPLNQFFPYIIAVNIDTEPELPKVKSKTITFPKDK